MFVFYQPLRHNRMRYLVNKYLWVDSEFSFSLTGYLTKTKELNFPYYLHNVGGWIDWFLPLPEELARISVHDLNLWHWVFQNDKRTSH